MFSKKSLPRPALGEGLRPGRCLQKVWLVCVPRFIAGNGAGMAQGVGSGMVPEAAQNVVTETAQNVVTECVPEYVPE